MPSIDLSRYEQKKKKTTKASQTNNEGGLMALLNKDISFGSKELNDKKKESLYLELSSLLQAGINLKSSFELIIAALEKEKDRQLYKTIEEAVLSGTTFSQALRQTGKFSLYEVYSLQIGEETGKLIEVLQDLATFYQNKIKQRRKIVSALTYPCVVLCSSLGAVFFMLKFVVPMFGDVFRRFGGQLPWITEKIIGVSNAMEHNFWRFVILLILIIGFILFTRKTEQFRRIFSQFLLSTPLIGNLVQKIYLARFCNSMRLLINAKLPLLRAIALIRQMISYYPIESSLQKVEDDIMKGKSLHESLQQFKIYPSKMIQLVKVGEETNQLDYFFGIISDQYIEEVEFKTSTLSSMMEPLIIIFLGLIVGIILIAMYLPLFQMSNSFQ
ncbi:type II secretion system protein F (GspF) [Mucilaginibacter frigoritolerans]|uniref:General secretion pathway protein F n=1 Tax=Mucilaginibacter frigoritolerans TaxID=652788 RepID=A0A562TLU6_9SPHI|nr:type II secretion system F family protein [Mucilaginibacter frigoritolerans]TWI94539.1 type II secretion system protein F (GspF) [Mucilaginibacter frigoritolerans]